VDRSRELIGELADYTAGRLRGARR
jgi:hypothetical protein